MKIENIFNLRINHKNTKSFKLIYQLEKIVLTTKSTIGTSTYLNCF